MPHTLELCRVDCCTVVLLALFQVYNIRLLTVGYVRLSAKDRSVFAVDVLKCLPRKSGAHQARWVELLCDS